MWKLTRKDKRLLACLLLFCVVSGLVFLAILPLRAANQDWEMLLASYEDQRTAIRRKTEKLTELEAECEMERAQVEALRARVCPVMETYEIDALLTGQVTAFGARILEMKLEALQGVDESTTLFTAPVELKLSGTRETLEGLLGVWSARVPGLWIVRFSWEEGRADPSSEILRVGLEFLMYGGEKGGKSQ